MHTANITKYNIFFSSGIIFPVTYHPITKYPTTTDWHAIKKISSFVFFKNFFIFLLYVPHDKRSKESIQIYFPSTIANIIKNILLSIKCIFFDDRSKQKAKEVQGILLKNENGQLMISKESIENIVKNTVLGFENIQECKTRIDVNSENQLRITLFLTVNENVVIKELASNLQTKIKEEVKKVSDLDVQEVNVKVMGLQENKKSKE